MNEKRVVGNVMGYSALVFIIISFLYASGVDSRSNVQSVRAQPTATARPPKPTTTPTAPIRHLNINPSSLTITAGHSTTFTAVAYDEFENPIPIVLDDGPLFFTSNGSGTISSPR
ncbi:MAG: hypothetical protein V3T49_04375, partial [Dehalococcoidia bacterium]